MFIIKTMEPNFCFLYGKKMGFLWLTVKKTDEHFIADKMLLQKAHIIKKISQKYRDFFSTKAWLYIDNQYWLKALRLLSLSLSLSLCLSLSHTHTLSFPYVKETKTLPSDGFFPWLKKVSESIWKVEQNENVKMLLCRENKILELMLKIWLQGWDLPLESSSS